MIRDALKRLAVTGFMLGSLILIFLGWYAYFFLRTAELHKVIVGSLFFGGCALTGFVYLKDGPRGFALNLRDLTKRQKFLLGMATLFLAIGSLWVVVSRNVHVLIRGISLIGFFAFLYGSVRYFKRNSGNSENRGKPEASRENRRRSEW